MKAKYYFGILYYDKISEVVLDNLPKLMRQLVLIYEHKVMTNKRVKFLCKNEYLDGEAPVLKIV